MEDQRAPSEWEMDDWAGNFSRTMPLTNQLDVMAEPWQKPRKGDA